MKVVVIGLGSMGQRRIRLLKQMDKEIEITGIDINEKRRLDTKEKFQIHIKDDIVKSCKDEKFDAALVCTAPLTHANIINTCLECDLHVFTEINVVEDGYSELIKKAKEKNKILFLSSTMLYRKEIQYIEQRVKGQGKEKVNYIYHVGQYLPDWHPWESYKDFFVKEKRTNGCRELFAIELPWLINVFGEVADFHVQKNKMTQLDISYNDNYIVNFSHVSGHKGVLVLDIVSRKAIRRLQLIGEHLLLTWEGMPSTLKEYDLLVKQDKQIETYAQVDKDNRYSENIIENAYCDEIKHFMEAVRGQRKLIYTFEQDKAILELINRIEN